MTIRRRTAAALCALVLLLSALGVAALALRPSSLRTFVLEEIGGRLVEGLEPELDSVAYEFGEGRIRLEGLRILRREPTREVLASFPRIDVSSRAWQLVARLGVTDVRVHDPEILFERTADGRFPLLEAFRAPPATPPGEEAAASRRPRIRVEGGLLRIRAPGILAPGEEVRLAIGRLELQESTRGGPSGFEGNLVETGSPLRGGTGALGPVALRGDLPLSPRGLRMQVDRFHWDEFLLERLDGALRDRLSVLSIEGAFGDGPDAPGLELALEPGEGPPSLAVVVRPRDANFLVPALPILFTGTTGTVTWREGTLEMRDLIVRRGAAEFHVDGRVAELGPEATGRVEFWARDLYLDRGLRNAMPPAVREVWDAYGLSGVVDLTEADRGEPGSFDCFIERRSPGAPLRVGVGARLRDGAMSYHGYPGPDGTPLGFDYPLTGVTGRVRVDHDGEATDVGLRDIEGRHGEVVVRGRGKVRDFGGGRARVEITIEADDFPLDAAVEAASPGMADLFRTWSPGGRAGSLTVAVEQDPDLDTVAHEAVTLEFDGGASFRYAGLPVPLGAVRGRVLYRWDRAPGGRVLRVTLQGLKGEVDGGRITVDGTLEGNEDPDLRIEVRGEDLLLEGALEAALREADLGAAVGVWDRTRPTGRADLRASIRGTESRRRETFALDLKGISIAGWDDLRFPVRDLEGTVEVTPEEVTLRSLRGSGEEGPVAVEGTIQDPGGEAVVDLAVSAVDVLLDEDLRPRLGGAAEAMAGYFDFVRPLPGLRGDLEVRLRGRGTSLDPTVAAANLRGGIRPMDLRNLDIAGGSARYADDVVVVEDVLGAMADREFLVRRARVDLARGEAELDLEIRRLRFPADLVGLLDGETAEAIEAALPHRYFHVDRLDVRLLDRFRRIVLDGVVSLSPVRPGATGGLGLEGIFDLDAVTFARRREDGPLDLSGSLGMDRGVLEPGLRIEDLEGRLEIGGSVGPGSGGIRARLVDLRGRVEGRALRNGVANLSLDDGGFTLSGLRGTLAGGEVGGNLRVPSGRPGYAGVFTLAGADARGLFTPADPQETLRGKVNAHLELRNGTDTIDGLRGRGRMDISQGSLLPVPVFDAIYRLVGVTSPPEFTAGSLEVDLNGDRMRIRSLDLDSSVLGLHKAVGGSFLWLDGRLDVNLRPEFKGILELPLLKQILSIFNVVVKPVYERLHTIHVGGTLRNPVVSQRILRGLFSGDENRPRISTPTPAVVVERRPPWDF